MGMSDRKKKPSDYPQMSFRLADKAQKEELERLLERLVIRFNANLDDTDYIVTKTEVMIAALFEGLRVMDGRKFALRKK